MAKSYEQHMVDILDQNCTRVNLINKNVKKNPDVSFCGTINNQNFFFVLESKVFHKSNSSNYPKQLLAEILINRDAYNKGTFANPSNYPITYGILLKYDSKQGKADGVYDYLKKHINNSDWIDFGSKFNCEYIFLFDETTFVLYYQDWKTFLSSFNPTVY